MTERRVRTWPVGRLAIGIDVGGSGIKAAVVDVDTGRLISERLRVPTPVPSTPGGGHRLDLPPRPAAGQVRQPRRHDRRSASACPA